MTRPERIALRIYVAGQSPNSVLALSRLQSLCREAAAACDMEVIDVLADPARALRDSVIVTPFVIRLAPLPEVRLVGNLSDVDATRRVLGLGAPS
jgi:circadian clock protein KaiB